MLDSSCLSTSVQVPLGAYIRNLRREDASPLFNLVLDIHQGLKENHGIDSKVIAVGSSVRMERDEEGNPNYRDIDILPLPLEPISSYSILEGFIQDLLKDKGYGYSLRQQLPQKMGSGGISFDWGYTPNDISTYLENGRPVQFIINSMIKDNTADQILEEHDKVSKPFTILVE